jgi:hypothetical protein
MRFSYVVTNGMEVYGSRKKHSNFSVYKHKVKLTVSASLILPRATKTYWLQTHWNYDRNGEEMCSVLRWVGRVDLVDENKKHANRLRWMTALALRRFALRNFAQTFITKRITSARLVIRKLPNKTTTTSVPWDQRQKNDKVKKKYIFRLLFTGCTSVNFLWGEGICIACEIVSAVYMFRFRQ